MEGRRVRRFGRVQRHSRNLLPLHVRRLSNTVSCWYCDFKTSVFNEPLFRVGRNYSRCLRVWFSVGIGFSLTAMLGVCMILFLELASLLRLYNENAWLGRLLSGPLFGIPSSGLGLGMSLADVGYMCMSTIISVSVHEFGHAFAAASEGIQIEYVAVFLAVLFPGALVAFNYELLQALPPIATLRIYCAGIWHNAACCAFCGLSLFFLPLILYPFYIHGESPMVLEVPSTSPLYGFLSPGDLITSLDGIHIHDARELMELATHLHGQIHQESKNFNDSSMRVNVEHSYCVPNTLMEASKELQLPQDQHTCPSDFSAFATITCSNSSYDDITEYNNQKSAESIHCLIPKDVVKLKKCGDGWAKSSSNKSSCLCSEDETCVNPVQTPDSMWVEITYSSPYTIGCWKTENNSSSASKSPNSEEMSCAGAFVFIGDVVSMAHSIRLTSYRPHWSFYFGVNLPSALEKLLVCTFHVSLGLALLNSLPVYFLDGESILEATLCYLKLLSPRMQGRVLQLCFFGGTVISILAFLRILFSTILYT